MKSVLLKAVSLITVLVLSATFVYAGKPPRVGVTYSPRQSAYLDQDWKKTYLETLDMGFDIIRLGAYWSEIEKEEGVYNFTVLDWQIAQAKKRKIPVVLTVGMKAPRWPEYFIPQWVLKRTSLGFGADVAKSDYLRKKVIEFIQQVVFHYQKEAAVHYWQVENEPLDRAGANYWWIDKEFLKREVKAVRMIDTRKRPIVINVATYPNKFLEFLVDLFSSNKPIPEAIEICDILGLNVYPAVGHRFLVLDLRFWTHKHERLDYLSKVVALARQAEKQVWVTELQAEPWEPGQLVHKGKGRPTTSWPESFQPSMEELKSLHINTVLLWGVEYWLHRKVRHSDESWWDAALSLLKGGKKEKKTE